MPKLSDVEKVYLEITFGDDQPDVIYLMDGRCPLSNCKAVWEGARHTCPRCGWPEKMDGREIDA